MYVIKIETKFQDYKECLENKKINTKIIARVQE